MVLHPCHMSLLEAGGAARSDALLSPVPVPMRSQIAIPPVGLPQLVTLERACLWALLSF